MITTAHSSSSLLNVNVSGSVPYITNNTAPLTGMVRWNSGRGCMEIYDGVTWYPYAQSLQVSLSPEVEATVRWAQRKQAEEAELDELCRRHPGVQAAREQLEIMRRLVKSESEKV
jgi:hypothetical protein